MNTKPKIEQPFGDNPVLDILHIAYEDFVLGRLTSIGKLHKIMFLTYSNYGKEYINKLINIIIHSDWFNKSPNNGNVVHLKERGVEVYLNMVQNYRAEKRAEEAKILTVWILLVAILTLTATVITIIIMLKESH